jgi:alpha-beta hydrolase superfamily lysophospholipase
MLLLDHHPQFPPGSTSGTVPIAGIPDDTVAVTAHIVADQLVFVALDGDAFRVGYVDRGGNSVLCPEAAATPDLATSPTGFAYVTWSGSIRVVEIPSRRVSEIPGPAHAVVISKDLAWAAIRNADGTSIWSIPAGRHWDHTDEVVLTIGEDGRPHLTLSEAASALHASSLVEGPFSLRGAVDLDGISYTCFDSIHGTASVLKRSGASTCEVRWTAGRWVVAVVRENDQVRLALQRLNHLGIHLISETPRDQETGLPSPEDPTFAVEWVVSHDGEQVPLSRFQVPLEPRMRSLVTVHGGFGLSLRPLSGLTVTVGIGDIVYAHVRGGGELGKAWAEAGRGTRKQNALEDLQAVLRYEHADHRQVSLLGTSHGGWLALLAAMREPAVVDHVCVTSPITDLRAYLASPLGHKHRSEFPDDDVLDAYDPSVVLAEWAGRSLPSLMIICGTADSTVLGQQPDAFAESWRSAGGPCEIVHHKGGHYAPQAHEIAQIKRAQARFLGVATP